MDLGQCIHAITSMPATLWGFFAMGLWGGFTHCSAMCGPFVLAQVGEDNADKQSVLQKISRFGLLPYHFGRMTTYIALAVLFSAILNLAFLFLPIRLYIVVPMLLLAAVVFLVAAFPKLSALFPWAVSIHLPVPFQFFSRLIGKMMASGKASSRYFLGVMLGFMPCGMLLAALMAAASLDSAWKSGAAMMVFTIGTVPALFLVAAGGHAFRVAYPEMFVRTRQFFLVLSALWLFVLAGLSVF